MRAVLAAAVAALAVAAPAGAVTIPRSVVSSLRISALPPKLAALSSAKTDKLRSCQVGDRRAHASTTGPAQTERKAAAVACEQPPRSNLLSPDQVAKATAAALASLG